MTSAHPPARATPAPPRRRTRPRAHQGASASFQREVANEGRRRLLPAAGIASLGLLLLLSLALAGRLAGTLRAELAGRLDTAALLARQAVEEAELPLAEALRGELTPRLAALVRQARITELAFYDRDGELLGGVVAPWPASGVPPRVRLAPLTDHSARSDSAVREPEEDAAGGLTLVVPLGAAAPAGALLVRLGRNALGSLPAVEFLFSLGKVLGVGAILAGLLVMLRRARGDPGRSEGLRGPAEATSDVDVVLGTMKEVMHTLKDSESDYRDRWTAAAEDAAHYRRTNDLILESITSGIVAFDDASCITMFNSAAEQLFGLPGRVRLGAPLADVFGHEDRITRLGEELLSAGRTVTRLEFQRVGADGEPCWLGVTSSIIRRRDGTAVGGLLLFSDLTQTKKLREQMELKDRLSAVGEMAAGVAHELKNSLHSLMGFANLLREDCAGRALPPPIEGILSEVRSQEALVREILQFAKPSALCREPVSIGALLRDTVNSLSARAQATGVTLCCDAPEGLPPALIDPQAVRNAFQNLALNAVEAMEGGGILTITARSVDSTEETARARAGEGAPTASPTGPWVRVGFRDTGPGIREEDRSRIFTPFFSTKRGGCGLGLALVHKTITDLNGRIHIHSRPGVGTEFVVHLPAGELNA
jgi:PAS domain S-box-containing protein